MALLLEVVLVVVLVLVGGIVVLVVDVAGLDVVAGGVVAGLDVVGAFGDADGVCAIATEATANKVVIDNVIGLMVVRFC